MDHIEAYNPQHCKGNPVVYALYKLCKTDTQIVAHNRHKSLKTTKPHSDTCGMLCSYLIYR